MSSNSIELTDLSLKFEDSRKSVAVSNLTQIYKKYPFGISSKSRVPQGQGPLSRDGNAVEKIYAIGPSDMEAEKTIHVRYLPLPQSSSPARQRSRQPRRSALRLEPLHVVSRSAMPSPRRRWTTISTKPPSTPRTLGWRDLSARIEGNQRRRAAQHRNVPISRASAATTCRCSRPRIRLTEQRSRTLQRLRSV